MRFSTLSLSDVTHQITPMKAALLITAPPSLGHADLLCNIRKIRPHLSKFAKELQVQGYTASYTHCTVLL